MAEGGSYSSISSSSEPTSLRSITYEYIHDDDVNFVEEPDEHLKCCACHKLLNTPWQLTCGHLVCKTCLNKLFTSTKCPSDEEACAQYYTAGKQLDTDARFDSNVSRAIAKLAVRCRYSGCPYDKLQYSKFPEHVATCIYEPSCRYCKTQVYPQSKVQHYKECLMFPIPCVTCGSAGIPRGQMDEHISSECEDALVDCKYAHVGCTIRDKRSVMRQHNASDHTTLMMEKLVESRRIVTTLEHKLDSVRNEKELLETKVNKLEETLTNYDPIMLKLKNMFGKKRGNSSPFPQLHNGAAQQSDTTEQPTNKELLEKFEAQRKLIIEFDRKVDKCARDVSTYINEKRNYDLRLQCVETANYDGVLIWKIGEFAERRKAAVDGRILSLYSQPFYTGPSPYGYKMCGRVYLNGDGVGRGRHLSFFFVLMQGDYDELEDFPFQCKVSFYLLDQVNKSRHLVDSFKPDPISSSFKRPDSPMNIASGCPLFVPLSTLENPNEPYLRNNCIFLKIVVDTTELRKSLT